MDVLNLVLRAYGSHSNFPESKSSLCLIPLDLSISRAHAPTQWSVATTHMQEKPSFSATSYNHPESHWGVKCIEHKQDF